MTPFGQTLARIATIPHHTECSPTTTAHNARLQLYTTAGYVNALYINELGRLILAEFKLWRNPQARREVIGQILDYTKELASWEYSDL